MKFTAIKTDRHALHDGTKVCCFIEGQEYDVPDADYSLLQSAGIAPDDSERKHHHDKPKAGHPVHENKMAHPVEHNKLSLGKK